MAVCPELLANGACLTQGCRNNHDVRLCTVCNIFCLDDHTYNAHLAGNRHLRRCRLAQAGEESGWYQCGICDVKVTSGSRVQHERGVRHTSNAQQLRDVRQPRPADTWHLPDGPFCDLCRVTVQGSWASHIRSPTHARKEQFAAYKTAFDVAASDKDGIVVSHAGEAGVDFGVLETVQGSPPTLSQTLDIKATAHGTQTVLSGARLSSSTNTSRSVVSSFVITRRGSSVIPLRVGQSAFVDVQFSPRGLWGRHSDRMELIFDDMSLRKRFIITRELFGVVGSKADYEIVKPTAPYVPYRRQKRPPVRDVIDGEKPTFTGDIEWIGPLPQAKVPKQLESALSNGNLRERIDVLRRVFLPRVFGPSTYGQGWKVLLHVEELQAVADLERYDMEEQTLTPEKPGLYSLAVPGLAENRPSVIIGDQILVRAGCSSGAWYRGYVHRVDFEHVYLRFNQSFHGFKGETYEIRFQLHRVPLRRMHQAMETTFVSQRVFLPTQAHIDGLTQPPARFIRDIRTIKREIGENEPQLLAVAAILNQRPGSVPFVVFGPPGTGKTVTIVEAIRQLLLRDRNVRILACAPSNSAADLITERLLDLGWQLFRIVALSRPKDKIPKKLHPVTRHDGCSFTIPLINDLVKFRVIVSTCVSASMLYGVGLPRGHFTHIFVDEAGQATEPEFMIPVKTMAGEQTNIILSGDPRQLGPIVRSPVAIAHGLGRSYLDRLVANPIYHEVDGRGITLVKLLKNYRSHKAILTFPNDNFYGGELQPHADPVITNSLLRSEAIVNATFPVVFHSLKGKDTREASSPSFFNPEEATLVKKYVEQLLDDQRLRLKDEHLGIIAPYQAQCQKIRQLLSKSTKTKGIKVGSVEEFQGQERRAIILSTVRSSSEYIAFDLRHTLGFVANPRRFNVAVTRAQALLVVIGDPHVLSIDPLWRSFLNYAHTNGGWRGLAPDWDTSDDVSFTTDYATERRERGLVDINALADRLQSVVIEEVKQTGPGGSGEGHDEDAAVDKPWRDAE